LPLSGIGEIARAIAASSRTSNSYMSNTPEGTRTPNPRFRRPVLYPVELRAQAITLASMANVIVGFVGGATGFEPATPRTTTWCANRLRHAPHVFLILLHEGANFLRVQDSSIAANSGGITTGTGIGEPMGTRTLCVRWQDRTDQTYRRDSEPGNPEGTRRIPGCLCECERECSAFVLRVRWEDRSGRKHKRDQILNLATLRVACEFRYTKLGRIEASGRSNGVG
jgi:hypothetical protein